jgi:hypothetical protein
MNKQKLKSEIKETIISTYNLLKSFKWYVGFNLFFIVMIADEYVNPPAKDDPIFSAEAFSQDWEYTNQEIYVETSKLLLIIYILWFLLATSNMRNHPWLAKLLFLMPLLDMLCGFISALFA